MTEVVAGTCTHLGCVGLKNIYCARISVVLCVLVTREVEQTVYLGAVRGGFTHF